MDSRVRGNDGGEGGNSAARIGQRRGRFRFTSEWKKLEIRKIKFTIPANAGISVGIPIYIGMEKRRNFAKKRRHSRESGNLFGEISFWSFANFTQKFPAVIREFYAKIKFVISAYFFVKNEVNAGICR